MAEKDKAEDIGIGIKKEEAAGGGIGIKAAKAEIPPPLKPETEEGAEEGAPPPPGEAPKKRITEKIPIVGAVVKPPLRAEGYILAELTGYPGFVYTEEDLENIAQLIDQCGFEATPLVQLAIVLAGLHGAKFIGFQMWKKAGRPGDLRVKPSEVGVAAKKAVPGEETKA